MKIATWNIGSTLGKEAEEITNSLLKALEKYKLDILCLQEVITSGANSDYLSDIQLKLGLPYSSKYELSSAHIPDADSRMGIVILSKYKITTEIMLPLTNPLLHVVKNGKDIFSDDKGILIVQIKYKSKNIRVATGHMLPYHSFDDNSINHIGDYEDMYEKVKPLCRNVPWVLCGDFNTSKLKTILPKVYQEMTITFSEETRENGNQNDYMFVSKDFTAKKERVEYVEGFDHYLCVCNIELIRPDVVRILHLSDIHYGNENSSIDIKTNLPSVSTNNVEEKKLELAINRISEKVDFVVVSGDITHQGNTEGFQKFEALVKKLIRSNKLPSSDKFIIVPGNHDVNDISSRWENFINMFNGNFVRPWLESFDEEVGVIIQYLKQYLVSAHGSLTIPGKFEHNGRTIKVPIYVDSQKQLLIYALNSSVISKTNILLDEEDNKDYQLIRSKQRKSADINKLLSIIGKQLAVDPARIDPKELLLFGQIIDVIEAELSLSTFHKIVVLHHPVSSFATDEEIKKFSELTNAGYIKKVFSEKGIQLLMHGHKHQPGIYYDLTAESGKSFLIVSGGTIHGWSNSGSSSKGFYIHTIDKNIIDSDYITVEDQLIKKTKHKLHGDQSLKVGLTLGAIRKRCEERILQHINFENNNGEELVGWSKAIHEKRVGVIATAYGIIILEKLKSTNRYYLSIKKRILDTLWSFRTNKGGWDAVSQESKTGSPEATCWVLLAFYYSGSEYFQRALSDLCEIYERNKDDINSNFTLSLLIITLCEVDPDNSILRACYEKLVKNAIRIDGRIQHWRAGFGPNAARRREPSVACTAASVLAVNTYAKKHVSVNIPNGFLTDTLKLLTNSKNWGNYREAITIIYNKKHNTLLLDYYTIAWVIKALLSFHEYVDFSIVQKAIDKLISDYRDGYWYYDGTQYFIFQIYDALSSLEEFDLKK